MRHFARFRRGGKRAVVGPECCEMSESVSAVADRDGSKFDAHGFHNILQAAIGSDRDSTAVRLRDSNLAKNFVSVLEAFTDHINRFISDRGRPDFNLPSGTNQTCNGKKSGPVDVVAAYIQVRPDADELFHALRAVQFAPAIALSALKALAAISRYAKYVNEKHFRNFNSSNYTADNESVAANDAPVSRILKHVVKSRVALVYDVIASGRSDCIRFALYLLTNVAEYHLLFAKEIVSRFDLASEYFAPVLCTTWNHRCRLPFIALIVSLINAEDNDISVYLYTKAREALITCLTVTKARLRAELVYGHELSRHRESGPTKNSADVGPNGKGKGKNPTPFRIFPSNVQIRELEGVITFLNTVKSWVLRTSSPQLRRKLCASSFIDMLVGIAVAPLPPLTVVPRNVTSHHLELRTAAKMLLISLVSSSSSFSMSRIVAVMGRTNVIQGEPEALNVLTDVVRAHPAVAHPVLASGMLLKLRPELSSRWIAIASAIAFCLQLSAAPIENFLKRKFFEDCFEHESALVRYWGSLITLALTRSVMNDPNAKEIPSQFLPPLKVVYKAALLASPSDTIAQELFTTYQFLFDMAPDISRFDMVQAALKISDNDYCGAEGTIRFLLARDPHMLIRKLIENNQLSGIIVQAVSATDVSEQSRLWRLSVDVIRHIDLFPQGTHFEIDLYLAVLSTVCKEGLAICAKEFESVLRATLTDAYKAFDELHDVPSGQPNPFPRASLVAVGLSWKLRTFSPSSAITPAFGCTLANFMRDLLLLIFACDEVKSGHVFKSSYLAHALPSVIEGNEFSWVRTENVTDETPARLEVCRHVRQFFDKSTNHVQTPVLKLFQRSALFREFLILEGDANIRSWQMGVPLGLLWDSVLEVSDHYPLYDPKVDPGVVLYNGKPKERCVNWCDFGALLLETKSLYPPDCSVRDGFSKLRDQLNPTEYFFEVSAVLQTTENRMARATALQIMIDLLLERQGDAEQLELCSFARSSLVSVLQNRDNLGFHEVNMILNYSTDILSCMKNVERHDLEVILFCMRVIHVAFFHPLDRICVRTRQFLRHKIIHSLPSLFSFPSVCILQLTEIYSFLPHFAKVVDDQLLRSSCDECSHFRFNFLPLLDTVLLNVEQKGERHVFAQWQDFCKRLLGAKQTVSIEKAEIDEILFEDRFSNFFKFVRKWMFFSLEKLNGELRRLLDEYPSSKETGTVRFLSWAVLARVCRNGLNGLNFTESFEDFQTTLSHFVSTFCDVEISIGDSLLILVLTVLHTYLRQGLSDKCWEKGNHHQRAQSLLRKLCHNFVHTICSWMSKDFESMRTGLYNGDYAWDSRSFELILQCLGLMISIRAIDESDVGQLLLSLKENYFRYFFKVRNDEYKNSAGLIPTSRVVTICRLLNAAVIYFDNSCSSAELGHVFASAQGLLSLECFGFSAGANERDICIGTCHHTIDRYLTRSDALKKFSLNRRGRGFFYQKASAVLQQFDKESLGSARIDVYAWSYQCRGSSPTLAQNYDEKALYDRSRLTDSEFLLRLFFTACREALDSPESPVLDLEKVVKGGLLAVAITALSASSEEVRKLGYACVQLFSEVVGPMSRVDRGAASGLYKYRRQLSFLLQLLQNSIEEAVAQVLPLFAAWFISALRTALSPTYPSYRHVTHFMLRSAHLDTSDCVGIYNLLNSGGDAAAVDSALSLSLEVLEWGVQTAADIIVVRKRKIIESLMFLASSGDESRSFVREKAFATITTLVHRESRLRLIHDLHGVYGIVGWLGCEGLGLGAISPKECMTKLNLISSIAKNVDGEEAFMEEASKSISLLLSRVEHNDDSEKFPPGVISCAIICAENVARVDPMQTSVFITNFANLWRRAGAKFENSYCFEDTVQQRALFVVLRQVVVGEIDDEIIEAALTERVKLLERGEYIGNGEKYPPEVLVTDAFISRVMVFRMEQRDRSMRTDNTTKIASADGTLVLQKQEALKEKTRNIASRRTYGLLAKSLDRCATIWLTIAGLCAVTACGKVDKQLETLAGDIPARPPDDLSVLCTQSYSHSVQALQTPLIDSLLRIVEQ